MRWAFVAVLPVGLSGCFMPPSVTVASYAADGASYAASGKSLADHGVSAVADKDCATWHVFIGRAVCEDPRHPSVPAPLVSHGGSSGAPLLAAQPTAPAAQPTALAVTLPPGRPVAMEPAVAAPDEVHYFAIGTFSDRRRAELYAARFAAFHPQLMPTVIGQRALIRVVLGPLGPAQMAQLYGRNVAGYMVPRPADDAPTMASFRARPASG